MRVAAILLAFVPFAWFAWRDLRYHLGPRKPNRQKKENVLARQRRIASSDQAKSSAGTKWPRE